MDKSELAWAAGFFDGEGSIFWQKRVYRSKRDPDREYGYIVAKLSQVEFGPLERFLSIVGAGKINGPYQNKNPRSKPYYVFWSSSKDAKRVMCDLAPFLSGPKLRDFSQALYKEYKLKQRMIYNPILGG